MTTPSFDRMFKALADPTRIRLINLLVQGELCVCDLMHVLHMGQSKISRHLAYLKEAGFIQSRKQGVWRYYALIPPRHRFHRRLLHCLSTCFDEATPIQRDEARLKALQREKTKRC